MLAKNIGRGGIILLIVGLIILISDILVDWVMEGGFFFPRFGIDLSMVRTFNIILWLIIAIILMISGIALVLYNRKKRNNNL